MKYDIGLLGGGQLARMTIQAAQRMGLSCLSLDPGEQTPASGVADALVGALEDPNALEQVFSSCERVTLENEFVPAAAVAEALRRSGRDASCLTPGTDCLATIQDKLRQREAYVSRGVPSPSAVAIEGDPHRAIEEVGFPMVLKARFGGYDGKGTRYARDMDEFQKHAPQVLKGGWMAEQFVPFSREVAVMVCRSPRETVCFPTMVTEQVDHVCDLVYPCDADASPTAIAAVEAVGGIGLFGVELFQTAAGFVVNEIAPRPHNSGHYTLDWGGISQFEAHVRLVMGLPVPQPTGQPTCMANLLGLAQSGDFRRAARAVLEADPGARVHWYGKTESRKVRKMGHINVPGDRCLERAKASQARFYAAWRRD